MSGRREGYHIGDAYLWGGGVHLQNCKDFAAYEGVSLYDDENCTCRAWDEPQTLICLPHSCDEWRIGGAVEARRLISDLNALLYEMEGR